MSGGFFERTPVAGTARSGLSTASGPFMALQNSPLGAQNFPHNPHRSRTGVLGGVHPSGYHPSWESGYGITSASATEDGRFSGNFLDAEGRMNRSGYKPAEMEFGNLDKQALEDLAGLSAPQREKPKFSGAAPIGYGRARGGNIAPSQSNDPSFAPNPGFGLVLSSREKDRFSGTS